VVFAVWFCIVHIFVYLHVWLVVECSDWYSVAVKIIQLTYLLAFSA